MRPFSFVCLLAGLAAAAANAPPSENVFQAIPNVYVSTDALYHQDRLYPGEKFDLVVTIDGAAVGRVNVTNRALFMTKAQNNVGGGVKPTPVSITDYALLVNAPTGFTYHSVSTNPALEPKSLQTPTAQNNNGQLWPTVPIPQYVNVRAIQVFKITYLVTDAAGLGVNTFTASLWRNNAQVHSSQQQVTVVPKGTRQ